MRRFFQVVTLAATAMAIALMAQAVGHGHADTDALVVTGITLIESRAVDATLVHETVLSIGFDGDVCQLPR